MLKPLATEHDLKGMTRREVIALLGEPGYADESYFDGHLDYRIDLYGLSAKNDKSLRVDYDRGDKVTAYDVEGPPCACPDCADVGPDKIVPMETLSRAVLTKHRETSNEEITIAQLEARLGRPGQRSSMMNQVGGQVWVNYEDIWRIANSDHRFFLASGHAPRTQWKSFEDAGMLSYSVISLTLECLTPKQTN